MGPALTHVSMKYGDSGWKHVTAEEAEALFPKQSVPAGTRQFICECCGQYVSFTKDGINVRHFKHSRGEEDKTCEERVARNAECEIVQYNTYDFPLRLALYDTDLNLSIGIPQCAIKTKDIKVTVQGKREGGHDYTIKNEAASGLVWLDLNKDIANSYKIKRSPDIQIGLKLLRVSILPEHSSIRMVGADFMKGMKFMLSMIITCSERDLSMAVHP